MPLVSEIDAHGFFETILLIFEAFPVSYSITSRSHPSRHYSQMELNYTKTLLSGRIDNTPELIRPPRAHILLKALSKYVLDYRNDPSLMWIVDIQF